MLDLRVCRQHEDPYVRKLLANGTGGLEAFRGVTRRHPDVDEDELGPRLADELDRPYRVASLADDLKARSLEQAGDSFSEKDVVVGQHHTRLAPTAARGILPPRFRGRRDRGTLASRA